MPMWNTLDRPLVLASQSPRRQEILSSMGLSFSVESPSIEDEESYIDPADLAKSLKNLAWAKANSVARLHMDKLVLGGDTIVFVDGQVLGKPSDSGHAFEMLKLLSGRVHQVMSGVSLVCLDKSFAASSVAVTDVFFRRIEDEEISSYLKGTEYADKAGAYG
ncbi:MAG: Maf family protein, partial [Chitinivibrionales bacterium]